MVVQFLRLGHRGYKKIMSNLMTVTKRLEEGILETGTVPNPEPHKILLLKQTLQAQQLQALKAD